MRSEVQGGRKKEGSILIKRGEQAEELRELGGGRGRPQEDRIPFGRAALGRGADGRGHGGG
jgi:hypothetical protein